MFIGNTKELLKRGFYTIKLYEREKTALKGNIFS